MTKQEQLLSAFKKKGILSVNDPECAGIPRIYFSRLCEEWLIDRIGLADYSRPAYSSTEYITDSEAAAVVPQ